MFVRRCLSELTSNSRSVLPKGRFPSSMNSQRTLHSAPFISSMWKRFSTPTLEAIPSFVRNYYGVVIFLAPWTYYTIKRGPAYCSDRGLYFKRPFVDKSEALKGSSIIEDLKFKLLVKKEYTAMKAQINGGHKDDVIMSLAFALTKEREQLQTSYDNEEAAIGMNHRTKMEYLLAKKHAMQAMPEKVIEGEREKDVATAALKDLKGQIEEKLSVGLELEEIELEKENATTSSKVINGIMDDKLSDGLDLVGTESDKKLQNKAAHIHKKD